MSNRKKTIIFIACIIISFSLAFTGSFEVLTILPLLLGIYLGYILINKYKDFSKITLALWIILFSFPLFCFVLEALSLTSFLKIINILEGVFFIILVLFDFPRLAKYFKKSVISIVMTVFSILIFYFSGFVFLTSSRFLLNTIPMAIIIFNTFFIFNRNLDSIPKHVVIASTIIAVLYTFGNFTILSSVFNNSYLAIILIIATVAVFSILLTVIISLVNQLNSANLFTKNEHYHFNYKIFLVGIIVMIICWLPYLLASWPGILTDDSIDELNQISGLTTLTNHHPLIHALIIKACYQIGTSLFHSANSIVAIYSLLQMSFMSIVFNSIVAWLQKQHINKHLALFLWLVFALNPIIAIYSITMWKDIPFACFTLLVTCKLLDMSLKKEVSNKDWLVLGILLFFFVAFKGNGFYAFIILIPFLLYHFRSKIKKTLLALLIITIVIVGYQKVLVPSLVPETEFTENLAIPLQQIAYTIKNNGNVTDQEMEQLNEIMDVSQISQKYKSHIVDPIKFLIRDAGKIGYLKEHKVEYFKLWVNIGLRNPQDYITAYVEQTKGYYYHNINYWIYADEVTANSHGIYQDSLLSPIFTKLVKLIVNLYSKVWHKVLSLGLYTYALIYLTITNKHKKASILPMLPALGILLTLLVASPVYAEYRYFFPILLSTIFLIVANLGKINTNEQL